MNNILETKESFENWLKSHKNKLTIDEIKNKLGENDANDIILAINRFILYNYIEDYKSYGINQLKEFIISLGFDVVDYTMKNGTTIPIYLPEKKCGFFFSSSWLDGSRGNNEKYFYDQVTQGQKEKIRVINIWDWEWLNCNKEIKSYIKAQLGKVDHRVYARQCEVRETTFQEASKLLEYHQQKITRAQAYVGVYYQDELVLCMLYSKLHNNIFTKNPIAQWEINREICKEGWHIVGGKSKGNKFFMDKYKPDSVLSYVDRGKFTGKSYYIMGYNLSHVLKGRYDWVFNDGLIFKKRQPQVYRKMIDLLHEDKAMKVFDSGRYCFIYKNPDVEHKPIEHNSRHDMSVIGLWHETYVENNLRAID
jgi:hypothetical protein